MPQRIACLQFNAEVGKVEENIRKADTILAATNLARVEWLLLPEMAFTGYRFTSLDMIAPFLERTASGPTTQWAVRTASRLNCYVSVGYPEITVEQPPKRYNSVVTVSPEGHILSNYHKSFLYYTDEYWSASEGEPRFYSGVLGQLGLVSMGICMDINPYKFEAPWEEYEFSNSVLRAGSPLVALNMAWITLLSPEELASDRGEPDLATLSYWIGRFNPLIESRQQRVVICANRCGQEADTCYAGTTTVMSLGNGQIGIYGILGRADEKCLVVDLSQGVGTNINRRR